MVNIDEKVIAEIERSKNYPYSVLQISERRYRVIEEIGGTFQQRGKSGTLIHKKRSKFVSEPATWQEAEEVYFDLVRQYIERNNL
jgi:hypothetical protein